MNNEHDLLKYFLLNYGKRIVQEISERTPERTKTTLTTRE